MHRIVLLHYFGRVPTPYTPTKQLTEGVLSNEFQPLHCLPERTHLVVAVPGTADLCKLD